MSAPAKPPDIEAVTRRSSRDPEALRPRLARWLTGRLPAGAAPEISEVATPKGSGMSSETLLFDARWREGGSARRGSFAARLAPDPVDEPVFPVYDFEQQFRLLSLLREKSRVPVPAARWLELDPSPLGTPFFVMDRVTGRVPPDVMPYTMGSWLSEAAPGEQRALQDASVGVLGELHGIDAGAAGFLDFDLPGATPLARHVENQRRYYAWARADRRHPVLERAFDWLQRHWPEDEGETVISWGDSRIGNVMYETGGFQPVAVLDWEMAALGPRELDLGWLCFMHVFFDDLTRRAGLPGMPGFLRPADVAAVYEQQTGHRVRRLDWYELYAALRHGIVMTRVFTRQVRFGQARWPADPDDAIPHRNLLEQMLEGTYWSR